MAEKKKLTAFQEMRKANTNFCKTGKGEKTLQSKINKYRKSAEKKGKSTSEINATIRKNTGCNIKRK